MAEIFDSKKSVCGVALHMVDQMINQERINFNVFISAIKEAGHKVDIGELQNRAHKHKQGIWSGKTLFSSLLPADLDFTGGNVKIIEGILVKGKIDHDQLDQQKPNLIAYILLTYGIERVASFMDGLKKISSHCYKEKFDKPKKKIIKVDPKNFVYDPDTGIFHPRHTIEGCHNADFDDGNYPGSFANFSDRNCPDW